MDLIKELRRRNVFKVASVYLVTAWLVLQIVATVTPFLKLPTMVGTVTTVALAAAFPFVCIFAWAFELTPDGLRPTGEVEESDSIADQTGRRMNTWLVVALVAAIGFIAYDKLAPPFSQGGEVDPSIAVLAFDDMSPGGTESYFADGVAEEILNLLAKTEGLKVAARTSSFAFKGSQDSVSEIGEKLQVAHVLEGSVRRAGDSIRVTAQLINSETGYHLWSETYDRELANVFAVQDEIASDILKALKREILGLAPSAPAEDARHVTANLDAYSEFLLGKELLARQNREATEQALDHFASSIAADPAFALPHAYSALALMRLDDGPLTRKTGSENERKSADLIERASSIAPGDPEVLAIKGMYALRQDDPEAALALLNQAIERRPGYALAYVWRGQTYERLAAYANMLADQELAYELDPVSIQVAFSLIYTYRNYQRYEDIDKIVARLEAIHPGHERVYLAKLETLYVKTRWAEMMLLADEAVAAHPDSEVITGWAWYAKVQLGLATEAPDDDPLSSFLLLLMSSRSPEPQQRFGQVIDQRLAQSPDDYGAIHMNMHYQAVVGSDAALTAAVSRYTARMGELGRPLDAGCDPAHASFFQRAGLGDAFDGIMDKCRAIYAPAIEQGYLCNCQWLDLIEYELVSGDTDAALTRLRTWLEAGNSYRELINHQVLGQLIPPDEYGALLKLNARNLNKQKELYDSARSRA